MVRKYWSVFAKGFSIVIPFSALIFVVLRIYSLRLEIFTKINGKDALTTILVGSVSYALANFLLVIAWRWLVDWLANSKTPMRLALYVYGSTQVAKYIPGNLFQYPSRHLLGTQLGLTHAPLLGAAFLELAGLFMSASFISLLGFFTSGEQVVPVEWILFVLVICAIFPLLAKLFSAKVPLLKNLLIHNKNVRNIYISLLVSWGIYLFFFIGAGTILWFIVGFVDSSGVKIAFLDAIPIYAVSWLAGTLTPGAPAGAGVRETIMILMLTRFVGEPTGIAVALLTRVITIVGDVQVYLFSRLMKL